MAEQVGEHPIYGRRVGLAVRAEYERVCEERDKWQSMHARADSEAERLLDRAETAEAALEAERERYEALANEIDRHRETLDRAALGRTLERDDVDNRLYNTLREQRLARQALCSPGRPEEGLGDGASALRASRRGPAALGSNREEGS